MKKVLFLSCVAIYFFFAFDQGGDKTVLLKVKNLVINKENPTIFLLDLKKGDRISFAGQTLSGSKVKIAELLINIKNLSNPSDIKKLSAKKGILGKPIAIQSNAVYEVSLKSKKKRDMILALDIKNYTKHKREEGEKFAVLKMKSTFIGREKKQQPTFTFGVNKEDQLFVATSTKGKGLGFSWTQKGEFFDADAPQTIIADNSGNISLLFSLKAKDKKGLKNLFKSKEKTVFDITIEKTPYVQGAPKPKAPKSAEEKTAEVQEKAAEAQVEVAEAIKEATETSQESQEEMMEQLKEMMKKDTVMVPLFKDGNTIQERASAIMNITKNNRFCTAIGLKKMVYWVYWIGVGENAKMVYEAQENLAKQKRSFSYNSLLEAYGNTIMENMNVKQATPFFPNDRDYANFFGEDIEYAIVEGDANKNAFEANENYELFNGFGSKGIYHDYGNSIMPDNDLFLCVCNDNKVTNVPVFFIYEAYDIEGQEK